MSDGLKKSRGARRASLNYAGKGRSKKGMAERREWGNYKRNGRKEEGRKKRWIGMKAGRKEEREGWKNDGVSKRRKTKIKH